MLDPTTLLLLTHITSKDAIANSSPLNPPACSHASKLDQARPAIAPLTDCISTPEASSKSPKPSFSDDQTPQKEFISPLLSEAAASALALPKSFIKLPKVGYSPPIRRLSPPGVLLKLGSQGHIVIKLQGKLKSLGYYPEEIDGVYGLQTLKAVSKFQQAEGLRADGIVGASTWIKLRERSQSSASPNLEEKLEDKQRRRKRQSIPAPKIAQAIEETPTFSPVESGESSPRPSENPQSLRNNWAEANLASPSPKPTQTTLRKQPLTWQSTKTPTQSNPLSRWLFVWALIYLGGMAKIFGKSRGGSGFEFLSAIFKSTRLKQILKTNPLNSQAWANEMVTDRDMLIGAFPSWNPETGDCYSYSLIDNVEGYFILIDNELRLADSALLKPTKDMAYTVTVRRTNESGRTVDKSFVVRIPKAGDPKVEDMSGQFIRESYA